MGESYALTSATHQVGVAHSMRGDPDFDNDAAANPEWLILLSSGGSEVRLYADRFSAVEKLALMLGAEVGQAL